MPTWLLLGAVAGATAALAGGYWDDAWHTERGRDSFFIAPHLAIYLGVAGVGAALAVWVGLVVGRGGGRGATRDAALRLAAGSVIATLASGPIDNAWHLAFGRDAVLWSPPHLLGIVGTFGLACALLVQLSARASRAVWVPALGGGLVLAAALFTVAEYETDVPQFALVWYLPALSLACALAFSAIRLAAPSWWGVTLSALVHLALIAAVAAGLGLGGLSPPTLSVVVAAAVVFDLGVQRALRPVFLAVGCTAALFIATTLRDGGPPISDALVGFSLGAVVMWATFAAALGGRLRANSSRWATVAVAALSIAVTLGTVAPAIAHDPGQGPDAGRVALSVRVADQKATVRGRAAPKPCSGLREVGLAARRAGMTVRAPARRNGCTFDGRIRLPGEGRWFVYAELDRDGPPVEVWLPAVVRDVPTLVSSRSRHAYVARERSRSMVKYGGGLLLYGVMAGLLACVFVTLRRGARGCPRRQHMGALSPDSPFGPPPRRATDRLSAAAVPSSTGRLVLEGGPRLASAGLVALRGQSASRSGRAARSSTRRARRLGRTRPGIRRAFRRHRSPR